MTTYEEQVGLSKEQLLEFEKIAQSYNEYKTLIAFSKQVDWETLQRRLEMNRKLVKIKGIHKTIDNFQSFEEFERYIFDNKKWVAILNNEIDHRSLDYETLKKLAKSLPHEINQPYLDKALSLFKNLTPGVTPTLETVLIATKNWLTKVNTFKEMNISFENLKTYNDISQTLQECQIYEENRNFLKSLPRSLTREMKHNDPKLLNFKQQLKEVVANGIERQNFLSTLTEEDNTFEKIYQHLFNREKEFNILEYKLYASVIPGCNVVFHRKNLLVIHVHNFFASNSIGSSEWCLARTITQWKSYITSKKNSFFVVINYLDSSQMVGLTINRDGDPVYCYTHTNSSDANYGQRNRSLMKALARYCRSPRSTRWLYRWLNFFYVDICRFSQYVNK